MNAAKVILEELFGCVVTRKCQHENPEWSLDRWKLSDAPDWLLNSADLEFNAEQRLEDRYGSVHAAAEKAATFLQSIGQCYCRNGDGGWYTPFAMGGVDSDLDLIAKALDAGWEG